MVLAMSSEAYPHTPRGKVWLVGAGPGDPDLLTIKALRAIQRADLILFDNLVSPGIRQLFPQGVPHFYVGKRKGEHSIAQEELNTLMVRKARQGKRVVRVKGGDPYIFGRGGEEALAVARAAVAVEVVPGITSASACAAASGIPLTYRGLSQGCTFLTAHAENQLNVDWASVAKLDHTLVFYMGLSVAKEIRQNLIVNGMCGETPVAVIENGCRSNQRTFYSVLSKLPNLIDEEQVTSPALIVVGDVVEIASRLQQTSHLSEIQQSCA